ncbi:MAG: YifB family Mg chelatase-like AAA ATPase [Candidatus Omnitrophica bacterium]|nr:YifB family Mg chelatase-like AAA ATPase [Candidatus Omnitrophota bacterium]MBD3269047.1 YifB family Mg chelatase-like AAA ATPase [Candidatus Omnitrophota bacterium]
MVSKLFSLGHSGLDVYEVEAEVDVQRGLPAISLVGLADTAVKESRDRLRSAIKNSGFDFPRQRITINLAPAGIKKEGTHFDLPIALGVIFSSLKRDLDLSSYIFLGELSLEGEVKGVKGVFPMALEARKLNKKLVLPAANAGEAALARGSEIYPVNNLRQAVSFLSGQSRINPFSQDFSSLFNASPYYEVDFSEVKGQTFARRALEVAVSGMHNILMVGPPGVGKTMLAKRIPTILPDMEFEEILEVTKIYSISGFLNKNGFPIRNRPYRSPHHTASSIALSGGGINIRPGEVTLAHKGVLFMDELPEFNRDCLEVLRQPLEEGCVNISRANKQARFPSEFIFVGAMNPCPCGYFGSRSRNCNCSSHRIHKYRNRISGPLLDRIDIHVELAEMKTKELMSHHGNSESSKSMKERVEAVRRLQKQRFSKDKILFNSQMNQKQIREFCLLTPEAKNILESAISHFGLSARAYDKILKVSRTIADLNERREISAEDISEAVQYRSLDKRIWV